MHDCMVTGPPRCDPELGDCGSVYAWIYFVLFLIFTAFIMLNLFIAIVLDNFSITVCVDVWWWWWGGVEECRQPTNPSRTRRVLCNTDVGHVTLGRGGGGSAIRLSNCAGRYVRVYAGWVFRRKLSKLLVHSRLGKRIVGVPRGGGCSLPLMWERQRGVWSAKGHPSVVRYVPCISRHLPVVLRLERGPTANQALAAMGEGQGCGYGHLHTDHYKDGKVPKVMWLGTRWAG